MSWSRILSFAAIALCVSGVSGPLTAAEKVGCEGAPPAVSPTPPAVGGSSGANSSGATGWTGGDNHAATQSGPLPGSEQYQPPVARGLDLKMPDPPQKC